MVPKLFSKNYKQFINVNNILLYGTFILILLILSINKQHIFYN